MSARLYKPLKPDCRLEIVKCARCPVKALSISSTKPDTLKQTMRMKTFLRGLLAFGVIGSGILHFVRPAPFVAIVPDYLPYPLTLVYVSGFFEILGGIGLFIPRVSRWAAWGLIALFIAVFPANIYMA